MSFPLIDLAVDLVWLRGLNMTHFVIVAVFYLLWRLPGQHKTGEDVVVWYDAVQSLDTTSTTVDDESSSLPQQSLSTEDEAYLVAQVPESTAAERWRFWTAKNRNRLAAARALRVYTDWRLEHAQVLSATKDNTPTTSNKTSTDALTDDERAWQEASLIALAVHQEKRTTPLPKIAHLHVVPLSQPQEYETQQQTDSNNDYRRDLQGRRLLHFLPGRMDDRLASTVTYATAVALYVDQCLERESMECVTVVIDARGGHGWRNLNAAQLLPFIQMLSRLMLTMFPQRLGRALVFPIPPRFFWVWRMARNCIDTATREKIHPLAGPSTIDSPPPFEQMAEYIGMENAQYLESFRKAGFL
uniref:CRAL-TRIO domain-containing protein n=1 Tax=Amphora coffeiformis TaxID=265554 RepID=A0A7S3KVW7_9STRA|mmetsp:Transcript_16668/g.33619  ORF Transcript_16668/g.33619 Transcript_16668/m.33619 type:complete len:357 (-) Transcript_16668:255-1325(-)